MDIRSKEKKAESKAEKIETSDYGPVIEFLTKVFNLEVSLSEEKSENLPITFPWKRFKKQLGEFLKLPFDFKRYEKEAELKTDMVSTIQRIDERLLLETLDGCYESDSTDIDTFLRDRVSNCWKRFGEKNPVRAMEYICYSSYVDLKKPHILSTQCNFPDDIVNTSNLKEIYIASLAKHLVPYVKPWLAKENSDSLTKTFHKNLAKGNRSASNKARLFTVFAVAAVGTALAITSHTSKPKGNRVG